LGDGEIAALIETAVAASDATSVKEIGKVMGEILAFGLAVTYVDSLDSFVNINTILSDLYSGKDITLKLEAVLGTVTDDTKKKLTKYTSAHKDILSIIDSIPKPEWKFQEVPKDGISKYYVSDNKVGRDESSHKITIKQLEKIWVWVSGSIANKETGSKSNYSISRTHNIYWYPNDKKVGVGCQNIHLWELEQFAVKFGWKFPELKD
jgi:hypothetical protein